MERYANRLTGKEAKREKIRKYQEKYAWSSFSIVGKGKNKKLKEERVLLGRKKAKKIRAIIRAKRKGKKIY